MKAKRARLDRFIRKEKNIGLNDVKLLLAQGRVKVDGVVVNDGELVINEFSTIECDDQLLQQCSPVYIMLNKPVGVVCATKDDEHKTVIDLLSTDPVSGDSLDGYSLSDSVKDTLHIVGRLDLNTSGLVLLTNDGRWSRYLSHPDSKVPKYYRVTLANKLTADYVEAFDQGMYFEYEDITTRAVNLVIVSDNVAELTLMEGRYHQIKRMFGRFRNPVIGLHRHGIGTLNLDETLAPGHSRELTPLEHSAFVSKE